MVRAGSSPKRRNAGAAPPVPQAPIHPGGHSQHVGSSLSLEHFLISQDQNIPNCQRSQCLLFLFLLGKGKVRSEGKRELQESLRLQSCSLHHLTTWRGARWPGYGGRLAQCCWNGTCSRENTKGCAVRGASEGEAGGSRKEKARSKATVASVKGLTGWVIVWVLPGGHDMGVQSPSSQGTGSVEGYT